MADNASGTLELSDDIKRAIRSMKHSHPEIGFKKLLTELRIDWPGTPKVLVKEYLDSGMQMPAPVPPPPGKQHKKQQTHPAPPTPASSGPAVHEAIPVLSSAIVAAGLSEKTKLYEIVNVGGTKGKGVVALRDIPAGEIIFSEPPLFTLFGDGCRLGQRCALRAAAARLSDLELAAFLKLRPDANRSSEDRLHGLFAANAYTLTPRGDKGVFLDASRVNYSCTPNVCIAWEPSIGKLVVRAVRDVRKGQELGVGQVELVAIRADRQSEARQLWGGQGCACPTCSGSNAEIRKSDARRREIASIKDKVMSGSFHDSVQDLGMMDKAYHLMVEEKLVTSTLALATSAYSLAYKLGELELCKTWAGRVCSAGTLMYGPEDEWLQPWSAYCVEPKRPSAVSRQPYARAKKPAASRAGAGPGKGDDDGYGDLGSPEEFAEMLLGLHPAMLYGMEDELHDMSGGRGGGGSRSKRGSSRQSDGARAGASGRRR